MPWSGGVYTRTNGTYTGPTVWASDKAAAVNIVATRHDTHDQDLAQGINTALCKDGSNTPTADLNIGGFKLSNIAPGVAGSDAARIDQLPGIGSYQPLDAGLTSISGLATAANTGLYTTALDTYAVFTLTAGGRALSGVAGSANTFPYFSSLNTAALATITAAGLAILDDANAAAQRTTLGIGTLGTQDAATTAITGGAVTNVRLTELKQNVTAAASTTINLSLGHVVALSQAVSITSLAFSNPPTTGEAFTVTIIRTKDATATARTIAWPASVKWPGGTAPTLTSTTSAVDVITLISVDAGTTYRATSALAFA